MDNATKQEFKAIRIPSLSTRSIDSDEKIARVEVTEKFSHVAAHLLGGNIGKGIDECLRRFSLADRFGQQPPDSGPDRIQVKDGIIVGPDQEDGMVDLAGDDFWMPHQTGQIRAFPWTCRRSKSTASSPVR